MPRRIRFLRNRKPRFAAEVNAAAAVQILNIAFSVGTPTRLVLTLSQNPALALSLGWSMTFIVSGLPVSAVTATIGAANELRIEAAGPITGGTELRINGAQNGIRFAGLPWRPAFASLDISPYT